MESHRLALLEARKLYSEVARFFERKIQSNGLSPVLSEQIIGVGVAADWLRRAAEMERIEFIGSQLNDSKRSPSFVELLRFDFTWFASNAIFTRPELRDLIGKPKGTAELDQFLVLYDNASIINASAIEARLQAILAAPTSPRLPDAPAGTVVATLDAIRRKYQHTGIHGRTAKAIEAAAITGNMAGLDIPTIIYAFRNWSVHGNALDGSFGSRPRFLEFCRSLIGLLAEVHRDTAAALLVEAQAP